MSPRPRPEFPALKLVRPKRMYEQIVEQIEALIRSGDFAPGARLPGERELAEKIGVSRPSLREALIALETLGLIEVRVGDGTYVRAAPPFAAPQGRARAKDLGPGPLEQFEARRAIEPACAELAASAATPDQIARLEDSLARITAMAAAGQSPTPEHARFHTLLAEAARNAILYSVASELWRLRAGEMWETLRRRVEEPGSLAKGIAFRKRLIACLHARDAAGARAAMQAHLDRVGLLYFGPDDPARPPDPPPAKRAARPRKRK